MHRQSQEEVAAAARRRLELLGRELEQAGLRRVDDFDVEADGPELPEPSRVTPVGRHARPPRPGPARRLAGWVGDQVPETLRGRTDLASGPVLLVVALVALAVTGTVLVVLRMGGDSEPVPLRASTASTGSDVPSTPSASTTGVAAGGKVTVDVAGKVRRPGVATLPAGSRVVDALRKAGGARAGVDLSSLNLARVLVDGEQILVGRAAPAGGIAASASTAAPDPVGSLVNLNTASAEQLDTLPGVGPVTAQKILEWRSAHGAFSAVDELLEVDGIGEKTLADLAPHVTL
jgi:competence protein ComEA